MNRCANSKALKEYMDRIDKCEEYETAVDDIAKDCAEAMKKAMSDYIEKMYDNDVDIGEFIQARCCEFTRTREIDHPIIEPILEEYLKRTEGMEGFETFETDKGDFWRMVKSWL